MEKKRSKKTPFLAADDLHRWVDSGNDHNPFGVYISTNRQMYLRLTTWKPCPLGHGVMLGCGCSSVSGLKDNINILVDDLLRLKKEAPDIIQKFNDRLKAHDRFCDSKG